MQQEKLTYPVSFLELQRRYNLKQSALSYRIKSLGIKTQRRGRNTFLSVKQLDLLDKLNIFLRENPTQTIENFIDSQSGNKSLINQAITNESPLYHSPISDTPARHHSITEDSLINQSNNELEERVIALERTFAALWKQKTISENSLATDESLMNSNVSGIHSDKEKELRDLDNENDELWEENNRLKQIVEELEQKLEEVNRRDTQRKREYNQLQTNFNQLNSCNQAINQQLNNLASVHRNMEEFYKQAFHLPFNTCDIRKFSDGVYLKTKFKDFDVAYAKLKAISYSRPCT